MAQAQEAMALMSAHINQLQRTIWLAVKTAGGQLTMDEGTVPSLWNLQKTRSEDGKLVLTATVMQEPSPAQVELLVNRLHSTKLEMSAIQKELGLEQYPANFLTFFISDRLVLMDGTWLPNSMAKQAVVSEGQN